VKSCLLFFSRYPQFHTHIEEDWSCLQKTWVLMLSQALFLRESRVVIPITTHCAQSPTSLLVVPVSQRTCASYGYKLSNLHSATHVTHKTAPTECLGHQTNDIVFRVSWVAAMNYHIVMKTYVCDAEMCNTFSKGRRNLFTPPTKPIILGINVLPVFTVTTFMNNISFRRIYSSTSMMAFAIALS